MKPSRQLQPSQNQHWAASVGLQGVWNKTRFRIQSWLRPDNQPSRSLTRLTFASGVLFSGILAVQFLPLPALRSPSSPRPLEDSFAQVTGSVRQSVVTLYRAQRSLGWVAPADEAANAQTATANKTSTQPTNTAANSNPQTANAAPSQATPTAPPVAAPGSTIDTNLEMRVAIAKGASSLTVGVAEAGYLMDLDGQNYCNLAANTSSPAIPNGQGINFGGCQLSTAVWLEVAEGGYIFIGDKWFKGRVLLLNDGGQLLAVNYVLLYDYLSSVVGSEMYVHWPLEALKAQAVAARSYALTHHVRPASQYYDLDNTQRYQAYLGLAKETNTTQAAVLQTAGEFISYKGGIVESLYAASDQIVQDAHGGMGMSQTGAKDLAAQGYGYKDILGTYYPGTSLARLVVN